MPPCCLEAILLLQQAVGDYESMLRCSRNKRSLSLQLPIPCLPETPLHCSESYFVLKLKSSKTRSVKLLETVMSVAVQGHVYASFSLQSWCIHTEDSDKLVVLD